MVLDCFIFNDELDLLELRLHTLRDLVDTFVLIEAPHTHQGDEKPLHYRENCERFAGFNIVSTVTEIIDQPCPITREFKQRRAIKDVLIAQNAQPEDLIIVGDADEIAKPWAIWQAKETEGRVSLWAQVFYYYLNTPVVGFVDWWMPQAVHFRYLTDPQDLRNTEYTSHIPNAAWHWSFLGNAEAVIRKIQSYSHNDYNRPEITDLEAMRKRIDNLTDPLDRLFKMDRVELDETFPPYLVANQEKFRHLILK